MINANEFLDAVRSYNIGLSSGVPGSLLMPLTNCIMQDDNMHYVNAVSEGEAVGIAAGSSLVGDTGIVLIQNSGLGNIINPVTSLTNIYGIPFLLIVSHRGDPQSKQDAAQHEIMGNITHSLIDLVGMHSQVFPSESADIIPAVSRAFDHINNQLLPAAFVLKRDSLNPFGIIKQTNDLKITPGMLIESNESTKGSLTLRDAIRSLSFGRDLVISTTGIISRELFHICDRSQNFYMQGSMGTAAALGLGIALSRPKRQISILDGDGSLLMRLGSLATVGYYKPSNYLHVVFDNESYASTGGQPSVSPVVSFSDLAIAAGYRNAVTVYGPDSLINYWKQLRDEVGPSLLHVKISKDHIKAMPSRPSFTPKEIANRFRQSVDI